VVLLADIMLRHAEWENSARHFYVAVGTTLAFALAGRAARGVTTSGALAGAVIAFIAASRDMRMFWVLLLLFFVTLAATRLGGSRKRQLDVAEATGGRSASQVMANLGIAALVLSFPGLHHGHLLALAALAEVAADTTSSEIGTAFSGYAVLITTWKPVAPGIDGGISIAGTLAGTLSAATISASAAAMGLVPLSGAVVIAVAGVAGMLADSLLGALLERRGYLNNDLVNLLSTATAVAIAWGSGLGR
jgi:uncharacterized protein (TIGR00297 family)